MTKEKNKIIDSFLGSSEHLYKNIENLLIQAREKVYRNINTTMVETYWTIGKLIVEDAQRGNVSAEYGKSIIKDLSKKLTIKFGKGFDRSNLFHMKNFYLAFPKVDAVSRQLSWTHYRILLKVEDDKKRSFYLKEASDQMWSTRTLEKQVNNLYYERLLASQEKQPVIQEAHNNAVPMRAEDAIKDPYVLDFLDLDENKKYLESELESKIIENIEHFLLELGKGFSFVGRQKRIVADTDTFYIDLVFYNYLLKCFVLIDLKTSKLTHQDIGQMDMYVRMFEDKMKIDGDNPTIGIILCTDKNEAIVKYSVLNESKQLFASKYQTYLPKKEELEDEIQKARHQFNIEHS